eukprot:1197948-Karenia_brevis.AAC.1
MPEELHSSNKWSSDMSSPLQKHSEVLNPLHDEHSAHVLFTTDCQKQYTGLLEDLCSLPQSSAPLQV